MFLTNSKVVVVASNTKAKSSPRVGSIGYSGSVNLNIYRPSPKSKYSASNMLVTFVRYGYQERERCETQWCAVVQPHKLSYTVDGFETIDTLIKDVSKLNISSRPAIVLAPIPQHDRFSSSSVEQLNDRISSIVAITNAPETAMHIKSARPHEMSSRTIIGKTPAYTKDALDALKMVCKQKTTKQKLNFLRSISNGYPSQFKDLCLLANHFKTITHMAMSKDGMLAIPGSDAYYQQLYLRLFIDSALEQGLTALHPAWRSYYINLREALNKRAKSVISTN